MCGGTWALPITSPSARKISPWSSNSTASQDAEKKMNTQTTSSQSDYSRATTETQMLKNQRFPQTMYGNEADRKSSTFQGGL